MSVRLCLDSQSHAERDRGAWQDSRWLFVVLSRSRHLGMTVYPSSFGCLWHFWAPAHFNALLCPAVTTLFTFFRLFREANHRSRLN
jgi:hypothetical protein